MSSLIPTKAVRALALLTMIIAFGLAGTATARADDPAAETYEVAGQLAEDGTLQITETIVFADQAPETLEQRLATRNAIDDRSYYEYEITDVTATIGAEDADVRVTADGDYQLIEVDSSNAGTEPIAISYKVSGATHSGADSDVSVLTWRVLQGLSVQVKAASGMIDIPAIPSVVDCTAGPPGSLEKCSLFAAGTFEDPNPTFETSNLGAGEQITLTVGVPTESVAITEQVVNSWSLDHAFDVTVSTVSASLGLLVLGGLGLWVLFRRTGLDQAHDGSVAPVANFEPIGEGQSEFVVRDGIRPGLVGTLADERVDPIDMTASLVDLAVRGQLQITELPHETHGLLDWQLSRPANPPAAELQEFETRLLDAVVPGQEPTLVSELATRLGPAVGGIQDALYDEVVSRGWFDSRPDDTRNNWRRTGFIGMGVAIAAGVALVAFTNFGLVALVLLLLAGGLMWIADRMPRRTATGTKLLEGLTALSAVLATQPTDQVPAGKEIPEISKVLPYTIVLGSRKRWLEALVASDADTTPDPDAISWYHAPQTWHLQALPNSLTQFINTVQGELFSR